LTKQSKPLDFQEKRRSRGIFVPFQPIRCCSLHFLPIPVDPAGDPSFLRWSAPNEGTQII